MELSRKSSAQFKLRHSSGIESRLDQAHLALQSVRGDVKTVADRLNFLASRKVERPHVTTLLDKLFPPTRKTDGTTTSSPRRDNILSSILESYETANDAIFPSSAGSAYNLLNAITGYVDHSRATKAQGRDESSARAESALFGSGDQLKSSAYDQLLELADGMGEISARSYAWSARSKPEPSSLLDQIISQ